MSSSSKKNSKPVEDLMDSLLKEIKEKPTAELLGLSDIQLEEVDEKPHGYLVSSSDEHIDSTDIKYESTDMAYEGTRVADTKEEELGNLILDDEAMNPSLASLFDPAPIQKEKPIEYKSKKKLATEEEPSVLLPPELAMKPKSEFAPNEIRPPETESLLPPVKREVQDSTVANNTATFPEMNAAPAKPISIPTEELNNIFAARSERDSAISSDDKTVAVTGFQNLGIESHEDKVKVSIGQSRSAHSTGYASWGGGAEASLGQAENLRIAQEKILELERENEKLRSQNDELISASDIIKERSDLLTAQISEFRNDKEGLEESFKNEVALLKGHLHRKEVELQKAQMKVDDLESRLKFDMKKIRIRERELENRLELIRAEKNAVTKSKDDQILDLRRKMDILQMEADSYRQKCVELNKLLENNQDSFKRTTRALRLAMANLELQEENKVSANVALKKVD